MAKNRDDPGTLELELFPASPFAGLPLGHFGAILLDPPCEFTTRSEKGKGKSPERHYQCMSLDEIAALPVGELAAAHAALCMWIPCPHTCEAKWLMRAWGYRFSGLAWAWIKYNRKTDKFAFGTGFTTRKNVELCWLGLRGSPERLSNTERDFIVSPRRSHSRKPDEQYGKIARLYPGPYLELFARQRWQNWTSWGDQADLFQPEIPTAGLAAE
jgi:N6-adenosine-specific RNA methylase IME4